MCVKISTKRDIDVVKINKRKFILIFSFIRKIMRKRNRYKTLHEGAIDYRLKTFLNKNLIETKSIGYLRVIYCTQ